MKEFLESPLSAMETLKHESHFKDEDSDLRFEANNAFAVRQIRSQHSMYKRFMMHQIEKRDAYASGKYLPLNEVQKVKMMSENMEEMPMTEV